MLDAEAPPGGMSSFSAMIGLPQPEDCLAFAIRVPASAATSLELAGLPGVPTIFSRCSSQ